MFKLPGADNQARLLAAYDKLAKDQNKVFASSLSLIYIYTYYIPHVCHHHSDHENPPNLKGRQAIHRLPLRRHRAGRGPGQGLHHRGPVQVQQPRGHEVLRRGLPRPPGAQGHREGARAGGASPDRLHRRGAADRPDEGLELVGLGFCFVQVEL